MFTDTEFVPDKASDVCPPARAGIESWQNVDVDSPRVKALIAARAGEASGCRDLDLARVRALCDGAASHSAKGPGRDVAGGAREPVSPRGRACDRTRAMPEPLLRKEMEFESTRSRRPAAFSWPDPTLPETAGFCRASAISGRSSCWSEAGFAAVEAIQVATQNRRPLSRPGRRRSVRSSRAGVPNVVSDQGGPAPGTSRRSRTSSSYSRMGSATTRGSW